MSLNKCVAMVLLLAYAVPAALGPGWHTHPVGIGQEHSGHAHHAHSAVQAGYAHEHGAKEHAHPPTGHDDGRRVNTQAEHPHPEPQSGSVILECIGGLTANDAFCVVCAFYAQTYLAVELAEPQQSQLFIRDLPLVDFASVTYCRQGWFARGPPILS